MKKIVAAAALMVAASTGISYAAHPLITDDTGTQGTKKFSLEIDSEVNRTAGRGLRETDFEVAAILSSGVAENVDIVIGLPFQTIHARHDGTTEHHDGISDMTLEVKWRFFEKNGFSLALKPGVSLPTGNADRSLGNGRVSYAGTLIATQDLKPVTLHANLGYTRNEFSNDAGLRHNILSASVAGTAEVAPGLTVVANVGTETNSNLGEGTWPVFGLAGVIYGITDNIDVDLGIKAGLNRAEADITALAGIVFRF